MVKFEMALVRSAAGVVRNRLPGFRFGDDARQSLIVHVLERCNNESATPKSVVWRAACDFLQSAKSEVERKESEADVIASHNEWLAADRSRVESLPVGQRYKKSGFYGLPGKSCRLPALPYLSEGVCRWANLNRSADSVASAAGAADVSAVVADCDDVKEFFAARELSAVE